MWTRHAAKVLLLIAVLAAAGWLVYVTPLRELVEEPRALSERLRAAGPAAPLVFTLGMAALVAVGVPRLILCVAAGMAFGFAQGLLWSQLGAVLGSYLTFLFARWTGRSHLLQRFPRIARYEGAVRGRGLWVVVLARQIPVPGVLVNLILGITRVRHRDYLLGTALGLLPEAIPATLAGAGLTQESGGRTALYLSLALVVAGAVALGARRLARRGALPEPDLSADATEANP